MSDNQSKFTVTNPKSSTPSAPAAAININNDQHDCSWLLDYCLVILTQQERGYVAISFIKISKEDGKSVAWKQGFGALTFVDPKMLGWAIALPIIGTYIVTSVVLLNFPWLVHRRKQTKFRCRHISHRGGEFSD